MVAGERRADLARLADTNESGVTRHDSARSPMVARTPRTVIGREGRRMPGVHGRRGNPRGAPAEAAQEATQ